MKDVTQWYECEGCGQVVDPKDVAIEKRPDGDRHHMRMWAWAWGGIERRELCGPVKVVTG